MDNEKEAYKREILTLIDCLNAVADELNAINRRFEGLNAICHEQKCEIVQGYTKLAERNVMYATARAYETLTALAENMAKEINLDKIKKGPF